METLWSAGLFGFIGHLYYGGFTEKVSNSVIEPGFSSHGPILLTVCSIKNMGLGITSEFQSELCPCSYNVTLIKVMNFSELHILICKMKAG